MSLEDQSIINHFSNAEEYASEYFVESPDAHFYKMRLMRTSELLGDVSELSILDCGCGPSLIAGYVGRVSEYIGVDLSREMIIESKRRFSDFPSVHFAIGNIKKLPFPDSSFDIILCLGAFEYVDNSENVIVELARVVKPNGALILSMLNMLSPYRIWYHHIYRGKFPNLIRKALGRQIVKEPDLNLVPEKRLRKLLSCCSFEVNQIIYYDFNLFLPPLDRYLPKMELVIARNLEIFARGIFRKFGTGYLMKATKK